MIESPATVPTEFREPNGRMNWEYVFDKTGNAQPWAVGRTLTQVLLDVLPFSVTGMDIDIFNDETMSATFDAWMTANIKGCWQMWADHGELRRPRYYFEHQADAAIFKLRWA